MCSAWLLTVVTVEFGVISCAICDLVICMSWRDRHMNESWHTFEWVMVHSWMSCDLVICMSRVILWYVYVICVCDLCMWFVYAITHYGALCRIIYYRAVCGGMCSVWVLTVITIEFHFQQKSPVIGGSFAKRDCVSTYCYYYRVLLDCLTCTVW